MDATIDVLVVDDEPSVLRFIQKVLTHNGYRCRIASDAAQALAEVARNPPDLTVTDIRMPGSDGTWLLRRLKDQWPEMAVIVLTAVSEAETAVECMKSGADDYLIKPFEVDDLLRAVRDTIAKVHANKEG